MEGAYQRSDMIERRAVLMAQWADYICPPSEVAKVVQMRKAPGRVLYLTTDSSETRPYSVVPVRAFKSTSQRPWKNCLVLASGEMRSGSDC